MCKLNENSFHDVQIAFANELSLICDKADINVWELLRLANKHPQVNIPQPGAGVGGHMKAEQDLYDVTSRVLLGMRDVLKNAKPDIVLAHGDTSTATALAAFYQQILLDISEQAFVPITFIVPGPKRQTVKSRYELLHSTLPPRTSEKPICLPKA